jgi:hypothetical protein
MPVPIVLNNFNQVKFDNVGIISDCFNSKNNHNNFVSGLLEAEVETLLWISCTGDCIIQNYL